MVNRPSIGQRSTLTPRLLYASVRAGIADPPGGSITPFFLRLFHSKTSGFQ
jgi:hypothetical protein